MEPQPRTQSTTPATQEIEDIFESSLNLEDTHFNEGYRDGFRDGLTTGKQEGEQVGLRLGFERGKELGFYRGCVDAWNAAIQMDPTCFSSRIQKTMKQMDGLIQKYPMSDPESVHEILDSLRIKFRTISATLGLNWSMMGIPKGSMTNPWSFEVFLDQMKP